MTSDGNASLTLTTKGSGGLMKARPCGQNISNSKAQVKVAGGVFKHNEVYIYRLQKVQEKKM